MVKKGETAPEYLLILDNDMLPHEEIMSDAVRRLQRDPKNGFVQYPQKGSRTSWETILFTLGTNYFLTEYKSTEAVSIWPRLLVQMQFGTSRHFITWEACNMAR